MNNNSNLLLNQNKLKTFFSLIFLGYFGIKVFNGSLKSKKHQLFKNEKPLGQEKNDIIALIALSFFIYIFTNLNSRQALDGKGSAYFYFGFLCGLFIPALNEITKQDATSSVLSWTQLMFYSLVLYVFIITIYTNVTSISNEGYNPLYYIMTVLIIIGTIVGLFITKPEDQTFNMTNTTDKNGKVFSGYRHVFSKKVTIGFTILSFILSLFVVVDGSNAFLPFTSLIQGLFIGSFVSCMSYYGNQYFFIDKKLLKCQGKDCNPDEHVVDADLIPTDDNYLQMVSFLNSQYKTITSRLTTMKWILGTTLCIIMVALLMFYAYSTKGL